ncbi:MAG: hypothetical protein A2W91_07260 [Bacteroidetes bacterium GWF2_38_335]|nr:MAG: hypothetical protein A2W91_07260 [Bacteroidetes bacterium GWF2_38_335]OFY77126.1 MAG: hypothetical protein A2281_14495 [Bacteroidetes bacterium RIFOXYA12_FULL_38_20]HBS85017.1 hypothetical protein [Bacteroidales bacterium]
MDFRSFFYQFGSVFYENPYWQFEKIIEIENSYNLKSTFFFLNETYPFKPFAIKTWPISVGYYNIKSKKISGIIQKLDQQGWEIGLHGSYNSYKDFELLQKEKSDLEEIISHRILGIRQHFLNMNSETWALQKKAGFLYDSSLGFRDKAGYKNEKTDIFEPESLPGFFVVPMSLMDMTVMNKKDPWGETEKLLDFAEKNKAIVVANWHHRVFNPKEFPNYPDIYIKLIKEGKKRNATFLTIGEYVQNQIINRSGKI